MHRRIAIITCAAVLCLVLVSGAFAQEGSFDAQLFRPSIFGGHFHAIEGAHTHWPLCYGFGLYANYASSPMEIRADDEFNRGVLNAVATVNVTAAFMPWRWLALGIDMPAHLYTRGYEFEEVDIGKEDSGLVSRFTPGDLKAEIKFTILQMEKQYVGLALAPFAHFPTGDPGLFLGEGLPMYGGKLLFEVDAKIFNIVLNGGYAYREERDVLGIPLGSAFLYGAGIGRDFSNGLGFSIEYFGSQLDSSSVDVAPGETAPEELLGNPMEILAFLRYKFGFGMRLIGGGGSGITNGVGAPSYRGIVGIDYHPDCIPPTTGLLVVDVVSEKGAPLKANLVVKKEKTGQFDTNDAGHFEREASAGLYKISAASKGYQPGTESGEVKVGKTTQVKIVLKEIPKPTMLTINVVHKKTGKPIPESGILIKNLDTGKFSGMKAPEGNWSGEHGDGKFLITGVAKGYERVDVETMVVKEQMNVVTIPLRRKIMKIGKVHFAFDSAKLLPTAYPVLNDVVKKIQEADFKFKKIVIEGHCSEEGSLEYNQKLSDRRAKSVMTYLISKGIPTELLDPTGFGETRPIASNDTEEGREKNRRVEFIFEE